MIHGQHILGPSATQATFFWRELRQFAGDVCISEFPTLWWSKFSSNLKNKKKTFNLISTAVAKGLVGRKLQGQVQPSITTEAIRKVLLMVLQHKPSSLEHLKNIVVWAYWFMSSSNFQKTMDRFKVPKPCEEGEVPSLISAVKPRLLVEVFWCRRDPKQLQQQLITPNATSIGINLLTVHSQTDFFSALEASWSIPCFFPFSSKNN